jgi:hypothetical protein
MNPKVTGGEMAKEEKRDRRKTFGGIFIPAGLFIGMGIGWALDYMVAGLFIGLGAGFAAYAAVMLTGRD